jgi:L-alanine-DL-glutamate epimerase-like enolase superfamily enzyme
VDIALWDLKAKVLDLPLSDLFGRAVDEVPVYGSGGFTTYTEQLTAKQIEGWVAEQGIPRVKIKIGESWGQQVRRDLDRVDLVRRVAGDAVEVFVDANGAYQPKQAIRVGRQLSERGVTWFEEPVSSDDLSGLRSVRRECDIDVAAGEYGYSPDYFATMATAEAVDCLQADATRCGGYTGWLKAAHLAEAHHLQISAHCAPNLHARVASAAVNLRHVEYFHDHARLEELLFEGTLSPEGGSMTVDAPPGHGLELKLADAARYRTT